MSADTREDHAAIWLQPECCAGYEGRLWCEHDEPVECDEGESWTKYVRADRLEEAEVLLREAVRLLGVVERTVQWPRLDPDLLHDDIKAFVALPELRELLEDDNG